MNSDKISWILRFLPEFWSSKVRLVRSLGNRTFQLYVEHALRARDVDEHDPSRALAFSLAERADPLYELLAELDTERGAREVFDETPRVVEQLDPEVVDEPATAMAVEE